MTALYPYQEEAVERIVERGSLLVAYEQGLGKTPLTITAIEELMAQERITRTVLVIVLSSLKFQWEAEIERWAPDSRALVITGTPAQRKELYLAVEEEPYDYVIVNYELVVKDFDFFSRIPWGAIVCDEATAIKSFRSKRAKAVKKLAKRTNVRIALTGTPISNGRPEEIFSMMEFVDDTVLGRFDLFDRAFIVRNRSGWPERYRNLPTLHKTLTPAMVRKRQADDDVRQYLPDVIDCPPDLVEFDKIGKDLYRHISRDLMAVLDEAEEQFGGNWTFNVAAHYGKGEAVSAEEMAMTGEIMMRIQALRMLCSHPASLHASADKFAARIQADGDIGDGSGSSYAYVLQQTGKLDPKLKAPKLDAVVQRAEDFLSIDDAHKIVIFSQFRDVIPLLAERLDKFGPQMFHGGLNDTQKEQSKRTFQTDPDARILVSSDAGGYGVDLPQGNLLINYDLPWTSADALQRNSRIIRASSQWSAVRIERFLMANSLEMRQWESLRYKTDISTAIIDGGQTDKRGGVTSTVTGLREVLAQDL